MLSLGSTRQRLGQCQNSNAGYRNAFRNKARFACKSKGFLLILLSVMLGTPAYAQITYSTGAVDDYSACSVTSLSLCVASADAFRTWYAIAGHTNISRWNNGDVWGSDFRDGANNNNDLEPQGGSGLPNVYFYSGHGICQPNPTATSPDSISVCSPTGQPNNTVIGTSTRWGNDRLQFALLDASCPMDLVSLMNQWGPVFQGLHVAVGNSGTTTQDTLDSSDRANQFAVRTTGLLWLIPQQSVGDAWMATGTIDIQTGCCAVATAAGETEADAVNRRANERITSGWSNPTANWLAWEWLCR